MKHILRVYWLVLMIGFIFALMFSVVILLPAGLILWVITGKDASDPMLDLMNVYENHSDAIFEKQKAR